jgi:hypothetical protein
MTALERLLTDMLEAKGALYLDAYRRAKWYLRTHTEDELKDEIRQFQNPRVFGHLFALGISFELQRVATERWKAIVAVSEATRFRPS